MWREETCCIGNCWSIIRTCPGVLPRTDSPAARYGKQQSTYEKIPKVLLYVELATGFKDVCKRWLAMDIDIEMWEDVADGRSHWREDFHWGMERGGKKQRLAAEMKPSRRKEKATLAEIVFTCICCNRDSHSRVGLSSHNRRCTPMDNFVGVNTWSFVTDANLA